MGVPIPIDLWVQWTASGSIVSPLYRIGRRAPDRLGTSENQGPWRKMVSIIIFLTCTDTACSLSHTPLPSAQPHTARGDGPPYPRAVGKVHHHGPLAFPTWQFVRAALSPC